MGSYKVLIKPSAAKELEDVATLKVRRQIAARIRKLAQDPGPPGCEKLASSHDRYRIRQGVNRIDYSVSDQRLEVLVVKIGHRKDVYR